MTLKKKLKNTLNICSINVYERESARIFVIMFKMLRLTWRDDKSFLKSSRDKFPNIFYERKAEKMRPVRLSVTDKSGLFLKVLFHDISLLTSITLSDFFSNANHVSLCFFFIYLLLFPFLCLSHHWLATVHPFSSDRWPGSPEWSACQMPSYSRCVCESACLCARVCTGKQMEMIWIFRNKDSLHCRIRESGATLAWHSTEIHGLCVKTSTRPVRTAGIQQLCIECKIDSPYIFSTFWQQKHFECL